MKNYLLTFSFLLLLMVATAQTDLKQQLKQVTEELLMNQHRNNSRIRIAIAPVRDGAPFLKVPANITDALTELVANLKKEGTGYIVMPPADLPKNLLLLDNPELARRLSREKKQDFTLVTAISGSEKNILVKLQLYDSTGEMVSFLSKQLPYSDEISRNTTSITFPSVETKNTIAYEFPSSSTVNANNIKEQPLPPIPNDCSTNDYGMLVITNNTQLRLVLELKRDTNPFNWSPSDRQFITVAVGERSIVQLRRGNWSISAYDKQPYATDRPVITTSATVLLCSYSKASIVL